MGRLTSRIVPGDWNSVAHAFATLDARLNTDSSPTFSSLSLTGLTENALMYADGDGVLTSLSAATNGQLIIGSTGAAPSVAALTGTANQVIVTPGAGSITLSLPQDMGTGATPTFSGLIPAADDTHDIGLVEESTPEFSLQIEQANSGSSTGIKPTRYQGNTFTPLTTFSIAKVEVLIFRAAGGTGDVILHLRATSAGVPVTPDLATVTIDGSSITTDTDGEWIAFELVTPYELTQDVMYSVTFSSSTINKYWVRWILSNDYAGGTTVYSTSSGANGTWTIEGASDHAFRIYSVGETEYTYTRWQDLYLSGVLHDGTVSLSVANAKAAYDFTTALNAATDGQLMIGDTGDNPVLATLTGTANRITITGGAGSITLSAPQDIHTGASPTFAGLTLSSIANEATDVDKFLVDSSGVIKYRTGSELLSDLELPSNANGEGASLIGIEDAMSLFTATDVEAALEEVMDKVTAVTYTANSISTPTGTVDSGDVNSTKVINDANTYDVSEVTGSPGFDIQLVFTGIPSGHEPNKFQLHLSYDGSAGHVVNFEMWNYTGTPQWDVIAADAITESGGVLTFYDIDITGTITDYVSGGEAKFRLNHTSSGNINHDVSLDYAALLDDPTGIGGISDHGALSGLSDDDHTQYVKDVEFTQNSGILVGTGAGTFQEETGNTVRTSLGLSIGSDVQAYDAGLASLAGLTYAAASFVKMTSANTFALRTIGETADDLEGTIIHDNLASIPVNDHIDHTGVTLTAGLGLTGSGDISASRTFDMDIAGLSEDTTPQATADYVATYDNSAATHKKVLVEDLGPFGSVTRTQTVNLLQSDSAAQMQTKIDVLGKYIPEGQTITFQFETGGTHTLDTEITFAGFFGAGNIEILGNISEADAQTKHTTQDTILDFNNDTNGLDILNTEVWILVKNLKIIVESDVVDTKCIFMDIGVRTEAWWCYFVGNATGKGRGLTARYCRYARSYQCLVDNLKYGLTSSASRLHAWDNDDTGTPPLYGLWSNQIAYIGKQSTQISGSTADELIDAGSQII